MSNNQEQLPKRQLFKANGKLLLTAEYFVLDGAAALAIPSRFGQQLAVENNATTQILWKSWTNEGELWFEALLDLASLNILNSSDNSTAQKLKEILEAARQQNPNFLSSSTGLSIETYLDFPRLWGLGTSSTLITLIAQWAKINPYQLLAATFGGSGYDIACATATTPILYHCLPSPTSEAVAFIPPFSNQLYFVYLGKKQNSREGIQRYRELTQHTPPTVAINAVNQLTKHILKATTLRAFEQLLRAHESLVSQTLELTTAKALYFEDYWGIIKSLGAWGGDFILATSDKTPDETYDYFNSKGFSIVIPYNDMVLN